MATHRFLHVAFAFRGAPRTKEFADIFNQAPDWLRYAPNCWILWTSNSPEMWAERVKPLLSDEESVLIFRMDLSERYGYLPKSAWDWLQKDRLSKPKERAKPG